MSSRWWLGPTGRFDRTTLRTRYIYGLPRYICEVHATKSRSPERLLLWCCCFGVLWCGFGVFYGAEGRGEPGDKAVFCGVGRGVCHGTAMIAERNILTDQGFVQAGRRMLQEGVDGVRSGPYSSVSPLQTQQRNGENEEFSRVSGSGGKRSLTNYSR